MKQRECASCRWCCFAFNVEVPKRPRSLKVLALKPESRHCQHECERGCALHETRYQPTICRDFICPYLGGEDIHRPDVFQNLLEELHGNMGNYIPAVPRALNVEYALEVIRKTRTIPAAILLEGTWVRVILPLDRQADGSWVSTDQMRLDWQVIV